MLSFELITLTHFKKKKFDLINSQTKKQIKLLEICGMNKPQYLLFLSPKRRLSTYIKTQEVPIWSAIVVHGENTWNYVIASLHAYKKWGILVDEYKLYPELLDS